MAEREAPWSAPLVGDRVALVTGGGGAIAAATCRALADHGADIVVVDSHAERAGAVVADVEQRGRRALSIVRDLTEDGAPDAVVEEATETFGRVDICINALGHHLGLSGPFDRTDPAGWEDLYRVNLWHTMATSRAVLAQMKERGWGRIVNFSSVEGIRSMPNAAPYTAFNAGVDAFTKSLGVEVARFGIRVNAIAVDKTRSHQVGFYQLGEEYESMAEVWIPAGRYGEGDDVASVALFLSSELSAWVVGQTLVADGGTLAAGGWYRTPNRWTNSPLLVQYFEDPEVTAERPPTLR